MGEYRNGAGEGDWCGVDVRRRVIQVPSPAAGADWSVQVPGGERWSIRSLVAQLQTSAVVANRGARVEVSDGNVRVASYQAAQVQAASVVARHTLVPGGPAGANAQSQASQWPGPDPFILPPGWVLSTSTVNLDVGDQWSQIALHVLQEPVRGGTAARMFREWEEAEEARWAALPPLSV